MPLLDETTFGYLQPTPEQKEKMQRMRLAAKAYADALQAELPEGPDKTFIIRNHRTNAMWANVAITRDADGRPRDVLGNRDAIDHALREERGRAKAQAAEPAPNRQSGY